MSNILLRPALQYIRQTFSWNFEMNIFPIEQDYCVYSSVTFQCIENIFKKNHIQKKKKNGEKARNQMITAYKKKPWIISSHEIFNWMWHRNGIQSISGYRILCAIKQIDTTTIYISHFVRMDQQSKCWKCHSIVWKLFESITMNPQLQFRNFRLKCA